VNLATWTPTGWLFNEIPLQLHLEMRGMDVPLYMRILQAIALGAHTRGEITQAAALHDKNVSHYLLTLQEMGMITVEQHPGMGKGTGRERSTVGRCERQAVAPWPDLVLAPQRWPQSTAAEAERARGSRDVGLMVSIDVVPVRSSYFNRLEISA